MCCDRLSLVYFPPFSFSRLLMMTVFPSPLLLINTPCAPSPHLLQHNLSIPNLEEEIKSCCRATVASPTLHMLRVCRCVCAFLRHSQVCVSSLVDTATRPVQVENTFIFPTLIVKRGRDCGVSVRRRRRIKGVCELEIYSHFLNYIKPEGGGGYGFHGALEG